MNEKNSLILNNGMIIPASGFGTCKHRLSDPIDNIIIKAIEAGYRYLDTASFYGTERDIGRALKRCGISRDEITVASKLWYEEMGYENVLQACRSSLERLGLDYLDIYMLHWPKASRDDADWKKTLTESWRALTELKNEGLIKALGVSNFLPHHLQVIFDSSDERPVADQLELHIGYFQEYAVRFLFENNIQPQAWSPLGRGRDGFTGNKIINDMAAKYNVSVQKLGLRFLTQRNVMPIVWSTSEEHMTENLDIFDFDISDEDISMLSCMPQENWLGEHPDFYPPEGKHLDRNQ